MLTFRVVKMMKNEAEETNIDLDTMIEDIFGEQ